LGVALAGESARELTLRRTPPPEFPFATDVSRQTATDDQIIIPAVDLDLWNRFRLLTMRPTFVDGKSHPYLAAEVLEWKSRVDAVNAFYLLPPEERPQQCRKLGATYYVDPTPSLISCTR
jgi:hypothetical protein